MKIINKIWWYFSLIKSGNGLRDKLVLILYFIAWPLRRTFLKSMKIVKEVTIKNSEGIFFCDKDFSAIGCIDPSYEKDLRKIFGGISKGIFIDIGANIGKYTVMLGKQLGANGRVIAIEPESENFEILKKNIKLNCLNNVIPINSACSSKIEKRKFFLNEMGGATHSFYKTKIGDVKDFTYVNTEKLDNIIMRNLTINEIKKISLIKVDVEGAEAEVLRGAEKTLKKIHPKIIFEAWDENYLDKVKEVLRAFNYQIKKITPENYLAI